MYKANELTLAFAEPTLAASFAQVYHGVMGPRSTMFAMLSYHQENNWRAPATALDGPYQRAHEIEGMSTFDHWVHHDPDQMSRLNEAMVGQRKFFTHWLEWFPSEALGEEEGGGGVFMVDVGGGYGHDLEAFAKKYPGKGRLVLQDLPGVLPKSGGEESGIEHMPHDFFSVQPIKGAKIYYMHKILHDWPDTDCVRILERLRDAMGNSSKIFVNDYILPNQGCPLR